MRTLLIMVSTGLILSFGIKVVNAAEYKYKVDGIVCEKCVKDIESSLSNLKGVNEVNVSLEKGKVSVKAESKEVSSQNLAKVIEDIAEGKFKVKEITQKIHVEGMTCEGCVIAVKSALSKIEGVKNTEVSLKDKEAEVSYDPKKVKISQLLEAINKIAYRASLPE
ncbi:MAG: copper ion binding protein [Acidobacteriota bacterium]